MRVVGREDLLYQVLGRAVALQGHIPDVKLQVPMDPESPRVFASLTLLLPPALDTVHLAHGVLLVCGRGLARAPGRWALWRIGIGNGIGNSFGGGAI